MSDDVLDTRARLVQKEASLEDKLDRIEPPTKPRKKKSKPRGRRATTFEQALKTETKGSEGERAFGAPIDRVRNQTTDSNNR